MAGNLLPALPARAGRPLRRCFCLNGNTYAEERGNMADHKVTVEQLPSGKWACFLQLPGVADPVNLGKEFKSEERSEEHTSELQSLMRISYAVFCLKKKTKLKEQLTCEIMQIER